MLFYGVAILTARRVAGENRDQVVIVPGPPLWRMLLEEVAYELGALGKRVARLFTRPRPSPKTPAMRPIAIPT